MAEQTAGWFQRSAASIRKHRPAIIVVGIALYVPALLLDEWVQTTVMNVTMGIALWYPGTETIVRNVRAGYNSEPDPKSHRRRRAALRWRGR